MQSRPRTSSSSWSGARCAVGGPTGARRREHAQGRRDRRSAASRARRSAHAARGLATGRQGRRARPDPEPARSAGPRTGVSGDVQGRVALLAPRSGGLRPSLTSPARPVTRSCDGCPAPVIGRRAAPRVGDDLLVATRRPRQAGSWRASLPLASVSRWPARAVPFDERCALGWCSSPSVTCRRPPAPQLLVVLVVAGSGDQLRRDQQEEPCPDPRVHGQAPRRARRAAGSGPHRPVHDRLRLAATLFDGSNARRHSDAHSRPTTWPESTSGSFEATAPRCW
jgi:hypothetical protein